MQGRAEAVILSAAKDLALWERQILRCAQDDICSPYKGKGEPSRAITHVEILCSSVNMSRPLGKQVDCVEPTVRRGGPRWWNSPSAGPLPKPRPRRPNSQSSFRFTM